VKNDLEDESTKARGRLRGIGKPRFLKNEINVVEARIRST